nr:FimV/HubP family polar landmark protein [Photobacterium carnosum]
MVLPVAFVTISSYLPVVNANTIRIVGPANEDSSYATLNRDTATSQLDVPTKQFSTSSAMAHNYGPTYENETLWGIASRHLPNNDVSIFKVIGAIYDLNHDAFENNNIHSLLPGSYLKLPTMDQIQQQRISSVSRKLAADQLRAPYATTLKKRRLADQQVAEQSSMAVKTPVKVIKLSPKPQVATPQTESTEALVKPEDTTSASAVNSAALAIDGDNKTIIPAKPAQPQVDVADVKMNALVESNHALRLRLSAMQQDMATLKDQVTESDGIRQQMVSFLEQQKQPEVVVEPTPETWLDRLTNNPWVLAAAGIIPGGLIAALLALLLFRRKKEDPEQPTLPAPISDGDNTVAVVPPIDLMGTDHDDDLDDLVTKGHTNLLDELLAADSTATAFNLDDLPDFDEQAAFDHFEDEMSAQPAADAVHNTPLSLDDLPEFDENSAFDDPQALPLEQMDERSDIDEQIAIDNVARQLQLAAQAAEHRQPAATENDSANAESDCSPFDTARHLEYAFDNIDVRTLPEFDENEALFASFEEQHELEQYAIECGFKSQSASENVTSEVDQSPEAKQDRADSAGLDMDALLFDGSDSAVVTPQRGLNNDERDQLLAVTADSAIADNEDVLAEDDAAVWQSMVAEPELEREDWSKQPDLAQEDIKATAKLSNYISIDELLADDPNYHQEDPDEKPLNLDVGLKEFPDMFANIRQFDVDSAGEYAGQLDLAKAYLEMNDIGGAVDLLQDIVLKGEGDTKAEANALLDKFKVKK